MRVTRLAGQARIVQELKGLRAALEQAHGENVDLRRELNRAGYRGKTQPV